MISVRVRQSALSDFLALGPRAIRRIRQAMSRIGNVGRREARSRISAQFRVRTGGLRRAARRMKIVTTVRRSEISARVSPLPRLLNIYEGGAVLAHGRGILAPRPVVGPAQIEMQRAAQTEIEQALRDLERGP